MFDTTYSDITCLIRTPIRQLVLISHISIPPVTLRRRVVDHAMTGIAALTVVVVLVPLFAIFAYLVYKGIGSI